jgi:hypothetical protein
MQQHNKVSMEMRCPIASLPRYKEAVMMMQTKKLTSHNNLLQYIFHEEANINST